MANVNWQLYSSNKKVKWFSKDDCKNIGRFKGLKLEIDTQLIIPLAISVPIPLVSEKRPSIPKSLRQQVWSNYFDDKIIGSCYICSKKIKNINNGWHCAHIIPYVICRCHKLVNLRVSCPSCNLQCGTENFEDYRLIYLENIN